MVITFMLAQSDSIKGTIFVNICTEKEETDKSIKKIILINTWLSLAHKILALSMKDSLWWNFLDSNKSL